MASKYCVGIRNDCTYQFLKDNNFYMKTIPAFCAKMYKDVKAGLCGAGLGKVLTGKCK